MVSPPESPRMRRLRLLSTKQANQVLEELVAVWTGGFQPARVLLRRQFARLDRPATGAFSDRKLPPPHKRPPSTRIIKPRGVAQSFYLTMLFVAQCERRAGQPPLLDRPLSTANPTPGHAPWEDLVMVPAGRQGGTKGSALVEENRVRQLEEALRLLASDDMRLVDLPRLDATRDKLEGFIPLMESGLLGRASRYRYVVPGPDEQVFSVPASFFLNGWHSALSPSELAMMFAIWASSPDDSANTSRVFLEGDTRIRHYGLSPSAYGTQALLRELGVLDVYVPKERRADGTFVGKKKGDAPLLNGFTVREAGFDKPAVPTVMATLKGLGL